MMINKTTPFAKAEMLIRRPVAMVFDAFINPEVTAKFWFTKSTGLLVEGREVAWTWEMYNHTEKVLVKTVEKDKTIIVEWGSDEEKTTVEWTFKPLNDNETFVSILNGNFTGDTEKIITQVRDSTEGFTLVLAGLKALLEHNIQLNLVGDRFPAGI
jgi:uncharacterized protein YndB with AHSA1/START domain